MIRVKRRDLTKLWFAETYSVKSQSFWQLGWFSKDEVGLLTMIGKLNSMSKICEH